MDRYNRNINERISDAEIRIREMVNVRSLIDGPPLDFEGWTMSPHFGKLIAQIVSSHHPDTVVECGSGTSTIFTAHALNKYNTSGEIYVLEHMKKYKYKTDKLIQNHSCASRTQVILAPLCEHKIEDREQLWYDVTVGDSGVKSIDFLLVDGPPNETGPMARYPAVPILKPLLSDDCVILVDDGDRPDVEKAVHKWAKDIHADIEYTGGPGGSYILRR